MLEILWFYFFGGCCSEVFLWTPSSTPLSCNTHKCTTHTFCFKEVFQTWFSVYFANLFKKEMMQGQKWLQIMATIFTTVERESEKVAWMVRVKSICTLQLTFSSSSLCTTRLQWDFVVVGHMVQAATDGLQRCLLPSFPFVRFIFSSRNLCVMGQDQPPKSLHAAA